jgi:hypothetical protein
VFLSSGTGWMAAITTLELSASAIVRIDLTALVTTSSNQQMSMCNTNAAIAVSSTSRLCIPLNY